MELKILQPLPNFLRINNLTPTEQFAFWSSLSTRELIENNNNSSNKNINNNNNINNASDIAARSKRLGKPGRKPVRDLNKPFQCETCEYSSKSKSNFTIHMRIHTGEKPFTCPECDYATSQKGNLRIHQVLKQHFFLV